MTVPEPPWKKKTRPCPFYSQGRCLFADSCNFLHEVKVKVRPSDITTSVGVVPGITFTQSPTDSNTSVSSPSIASGRVRSPPRSPRLSSLLLALGDAIEPDDEEVDVAEEDGPDFNPSLELNTGSGIFGHAIRRRSTQKLQGDNGSTNEMAYENRHDALQDPFESSPPPQSTSLGSPEVSPPHTGPINDLLSPIEVTLAPPAYWPLGQLDSSLQREDSVDSGYAEWTGPKGLARSPPRSPSTRRLSTLDLLSSPFGTPARVLSPVFIPSANSGWPTSPLASQRNVDSIALERDTHLGSDPDNDLDSPPTSPTSHQQSQRDAKSARVVSESEFPSTVRPNNMQLHSEEKEKKDELALSLPPNPRIGMKSVLSELKKGIHFLTDDVEQETTIKPSSMAVLARSAQEETSRPSSSVDIARSNRTASPPRQTSPPEASNVLFAADSPSLGSPEAAPSRLSTTPDDIFVPATEIPLRPQSDMDVAEPSPAAAHQDVFSPPSAASPSSMGSSSQHPLRSPSVFSRQSSISEMALDPRQSRASRKVPFGFRHSMSNSRDSSNSSRHTSTSRSSARRRRPPPLNELRSNLASESPVALTPSEPSSTFGKLKPLRLSVIVNSASASASSSGTTPSLTTATTAITALSHPSPSPSSSVSSPYSISHNPLMSSTRSSTIPTHARNTLTIDPHASGRDVLYPLVPQSAPITNTLSSEERSHVAKRNSVSSLPLSNLSLHQTMIPFSNPLEEELGESPEEDEDEMYDENGLGAEDTVRIGSAVSAPLARPSSRASIMHEPVHAIATPRPTLLFAIASDDVSEVRRVLESGEAGPNDDVGPQSALEFALTAEKLKHRVEIVKMLLAHGANPALGSEASGRRSRVSVSLTEPEAGGATPADKFLAGTDPATRYYIARADAPHTRKTSALIHRSFFRPLTKVRYDLIGQDRALEHLFRVLSMPTNAPIVVLLCGPSGHGKSLLARKFGFLLGVPTHTVNMTTLRSTHDIWTSYSMSPYETPSTSTLADFLIENEGKRCVVVLDEIEKTENEKILSSLLMPWELGRCSFEAGHRHVDVSKVIWLGTSNIGHDLVFEHQLSRNNVEETMTREEYIELMGMLRPKVSDRLGPSLLSRVTTVLPFVPFTEEEQMAIATEALFSLAANVGQPMLPETVERLVRRALKSYVPVEGARSLYRAVSTELLDML